MEDAKQMFDKCGAKKPDNATWGDIQYLFAMFYSDYFPKVLDCDQKIVKAVLAYLEDPDAPEGTAFVRYLAVRCFVGDTIKWSDMIQFDTTLENPVGNRIPIGFLFDRSLIMITFVRGRSFVHRKGGRE